MQKVQKQQGFTLIELIIVIIILGILAVTAAPRFIDIQSDAQTSTLEGVKAALLGGASLVYAKSALEGEQGNAAGATAGSEVEITGVSSPIETDFGYPDADSLTAINSGTVAGTDVASFAELDEAEWDLVDTTASDGAVEIVLDGQTDTTGNCFITYQNAGAAGQSPTVTITSSGC